MSVIISPRKERIITVQSEDYLVLYKANKPPLGQQDHLDLHIESQINILVVSAETVYKIR